MLFFERQPAEQVFGYDERNVVIGWQFGQLLQLHVYPRLLDDIGAVRKRCPELYGQMREENAVTDESDPEQHGNSHGPIQWCKNFGGKMPSENDIDGEELTKNR